MRAFFCLQFHLYRKFLSLLATSEWIEHLSVQGGSAGTSDDSVVSFGGDINASGDMALSIAATNTATVVFSGAS